MHIPVNERLGPPHEVRGGPISGLKVKTIHMHMLFYFLIKIRKPLYRGSLKSIRKGAVSSKSLAKPQTRISICTARTSNLLQIPCKWPKTGTPFPIPAIQTAPKQNPTSTKCIVIQNSTIPRNE